MSEEREQQLMHQMQILETYFNDLSQREGTLLNVLRESISAIESLKSLQQYPISDTLVPLGMGAYIPAKITSNDKVIMNIGAGMATEKNFVSAINYLEGKIKEIEIALQDNSAKKQEAVARLEHGKDQMNQLMQESTKNLPG